MAMTKQYEGYWEELLQKSSRFKGKRVRITVIETPPAKAVQRKKIKPVDEKTAQFIKEVAGSWKGDDLDECLDLAYKLRSETQW